MPYRNTFIKVAEDCPVTAGTIPKRRGGKKTGVGYEFELLQNAPYSRSGDQLIFDIYLFKKDISLETASSNHEALWADLFKKEFPCLRASSLTKRYGWGAHYNADGKIALYAMDSVEYQQFLEDENTTVLAALRNKRNA